MQCELTIQLMMMRCLQNWNGQVKHMQDNADLAKKN